MSLSELTGFREPAAAASVSDRVSHSAIIRGKIALFGGILGETAHRFWTSPRFPALYREYLFHSHSILRASVPLMQAAEIACRLPEHAADPVLQGFGDYLRKHIPEETGHYEWILDDAEAMGIERTALAGQLPKETAALLAGSQYYWIHHYNPIALAGYIAAMEGDPPSTSFIKDVARRNQLPEKAFSFFLYHAKLDLQHRKDFDTVLDRLPLTSEHLELIGLSSLRTIRMLTDVMEDILQTGSE